MSEPTIDRRVLRTKRMIRDALTELMENKGFDGITVRDLTEKADINRGTFYLHYRDKYDLLEQSEEEILAVLKIKQSRMKELSIEDVYEYHAKNEPLPFVVQVFEYLKENAAFMRVVLGPKGDPSFQEKLKDVMKNNLLLHIINKTKKEELLVPIEIFSAYVMAAHIGVIQHWLNSGMEESPEEIASILFKMTFMGPRTAIGL
ncbi:TetR/AcrR family transcriptional regulator [Niallia sp. 03133]|uniref:TetR/AcrR family transcriptional regulator n=1 Tax=Niallia sp. 03133 TaxID=3458060 RepID=UPI004044AB15